MKVLGLNITRARAPIVPRVGAEPLSNPLPPFGTNPPQRPSVPTAPDLSERIIRSDPRELWYLSLTAKLTPNQVLQMLRSALGGDLWQQWQLYAHMLDSWPMFRKCAHEIRSAISQVKFVVRPACQPGQEPTDQAIERADLVQRGFASMKPDPFDQEENFTGTIYDFTDSILNGMTMTEIFWQEIGGELLPRSTGWVHPRHFAFTTEGKIQIYNEVYNRLSFANQTSDRGGPDIANKFIISKYKSRSGSALGAGLMRPLALYWSYIVFNREWMFKAAQSFGNPFLELTYQSSSTEEADRLQYKAWLENAVFDGSIMHKEGTTVAVHPAQNLGTDNPRRFLKEEADRQCQLLLLGQTATTEGTPGKLGGEDAHEEVRRERVEEGAGWIGADPLAQLARAIMRVNYGNEDDVPTIEPDFTRVSSPTEQAQRYSVINSIGIPVDQEEMYRDLSLKQPQTGDKVVVRGQVGVLESVDQPVGGKPEPIIPPEAGKPEQEDEPSEEAEPDEADEEPIEARARRNGTVKARTAGNGGRAIDAIKAKLRPLLAKAVHDDLKPIREAFENVLRASDEQFPEAIQSLKTLLMIHDARRSLGIDKPENAERAIRGAMTAAFAVGMGKRNGTAKASGDWFPTVHAAEFDEDEHPREPAGSEGGGRFTSKEGGVAIKRVGEGKESKWKTDDDKDLPEHAEKLGIPPAWTKVRIAPTAEHDLQAIGYDAKGREQRIYSDAHTQRQAEDKFARNAELIEKRDKVFRQNDSNLNHESAQVRENAAAMKLIQTTGIRPGSDSDTKAKTKAYGATTLEGRHVVVDGDKVRLKFTGKKGVALDIEVDDKATAKMLIARKKSAGDSGKLFDTDDSKLRDYSHTLDGGGFKPKDFRTLKGTETAIQAIDENPKRASSLKEYKKRVMDIAKRVSQKLGNTPTIALQSYINPSVFTRIKPA